jgi:hypothetical protein
VRAKRGESKQTGGGAGHMKSESSVLVAAVSVWACVRAGLAAWHGRCLVFDIRGDLCSPVIV